MSKKKTRKMAMDLSTTRQQDLSMSRQQGDLNNNLACSAVVDLSLPRKEKKEDAENRNLSAEKAEVTKLVKEAGDEESEGSTKLVIGEGSKLSELLGLGKDPSVLESLLPQLDMAAINLLCLARLQVNKSSHFKCIAGQLDVVKSKNKHQHFVKTGINKTDFCTYAEQL